MSDRKPRIGILGIMQDLYDDMIPDIAARQLGYAREIAAHLADVAEGWAHSLRISARLKPSGSSSWSNLQDFGSRSGRHRTN